MCIRDRSKISFGGSKSGNPCDRFTAPYLLEILVILRITESVKSAVLFDNTGILLPPISADLLPFFITGLNNYLNVLVCQMSESTLFFQIICDTCKFLWVMIQRKFAVFVLRKIPQTAIRNFSCGVNSLSLIHISTFQIRLYSPVFFHQ